MQRRASARSALFACSRASSISGAITICPTPGSHRSWQACFPAGSGLTINVGQSQLLGALASKLDSKGAKGVMVRFNTYLNLYYQNGYFNNVTPQPAGLADMPPLYKTALESGNQFSNPCYSRVVGVIGPWYEDELATAPEGRFLSMPPNLVLCDPAAPKPCWDSTSATTRLTKAGPSATASGDGSGLNPIRIPPSNPQAGGLLGVALAEVDYQRNIISIDVLNTFPEETWSGEKADFKEITVGVQSGDSFRAIATLPFGGYNATAYEVGGGIVDLPFDPALAPAIRDGLLAFRVQPRVWVAEVVNPNIPTYRPVETRTVMIETPLVAQTDQRGVYLEENGSGNFQVSIKAKGRPAAGAMMRMVKYVPNSVEASASLFPIAATADQIVDINSGSGENVTIDIGNNQSITTKASTVTADANGMVTVKVTALGSGFPVIVFYPYPSGGTPPAPMGRFSEALTSMFTAIRVLPYDDAFVDQFVQLWNSSYDPDKAWKFVYGEILYLYDMIFPVMLKFVPLDERHRVEAAIDQVLALVAPSYFPESTLAMPITRDLSRGKRTVIELWGSLVKKNYPPQPISKPSAATS